MKILLVVDGSAYSDWGALPKESPGMLPVRC
jgi:hypothetical protein